MGYVNSMENKAYRFRIYPDEAQKSLFEKTFGCCRFVWNHLLDERIRLFELTGKHINSTPAHLKSEYPFLKDVDAQALCNVQLQLNRAYLNNRKNNNGNKELYPKFRSKHHSRPSYTTNLIKQNIRISEDGKYIRLPKTGDVRLVRHRSLKKGERIKAVTVSRESAGKYFVSILVEYSAKPVVPVCINEEKVVGLDYSSPNFYVDNNGRIPFGHERWFRNSEVKLAREQRKLSHMKKGSANWNKQKTKVSSIYVRISNSRKDWIEKETARLVEEYDAVVVEDIDMMKISQGFCLGKSTLDNGWGYFRQRLKRKLEQKGKRLVVIDRWTPSTKKCCRCGYHIPGITLSDRVVACPQCGNVMDRDIQAAINIRQSGIKALRDAEEEPVDTVDFGLLEQETKRSRLLT